MPVKRQIWSFFRISFSYGTARESELFHREQMRKIRIVKSECESKGEKNDESVGN